MPNDAFERQVHDHLRLFSAPDYTAKGDAVNFFKINHRKAIPILEQLAARNNRVAAQALTIARNAAPKNTGNQRNNAKRRGLF